jgi:hypothetical protein
MNKIKLEVEFKSLPEYYEKERLGLKCNTVRLHDKRGDNRFNLLDLWLAGELRELYVKIKNTDTKKIFKRKITDVTKFDDYYIISWRHQ